MNNHCIGGVLLLAVAVLISSCASTNIDFAALNADGSPVWTTSVPQSTKYIYGVGNAKFSNERNSSAAADARARADLSRRLQSTIQDATAVYLADSGGAVAEAFETITVQAVHLTVQGIQVERRYVSGDGTAYSLVSFEAKKLKELYQMAANDYLENQKLTRKEERNEYLSDLKDLLNNGSKTADTAGEPVDAEKLAKILEAGLRELGYTE